MSDLTLVCQDEKRREAVRSHELNGLDYLEVSEDQYKLTVYLLGKAPEDLRRENISILGGRRVRDIKVIDLDVRFSGDPEIDDCLVVTVNKWGDFSTYQLCLVELDEDGRKTDIPFHGFDPRYACLDFSFKAGCPNDLDCEPTEICPAEPLDEPEINYLAKDYASFRQLIFDRLALVMPDWKERHVPDIGVALVEVMAYVGDYLSYYQDAVATEAYLDTARQRTSIRRHTRLVDYHLHNGCNARVWLCIEVSADVTLDLKDIFFTTGLDDVLPNAESLLSTDDLRGISRESYEAFEPLWPGREDSIRLMEAHNVIHFYTWGDEQCCLDKGSTSATLKDEWITSSPATSKKPYQEAHEQYRQSEEQEPEQQDRRLQLKVDDVLILEEVKGPNSGDRADADPTHRHAVCLTKVETTIDPLYDQPLVEIEWCEEDALPFPLCLSNLGRPPECELIEGISVACGNVLLVDHGWRVEDEPLEQVPFEKIPPDCGDDCRPPVVMKRPGKFRPILREKPVVYAQSLPEKTSATGFLEQDCPQAMPQIGVWGIPAASNSKPLFESKDLQNPEHLIVRLKKKEAFEIQILRGLLSPQTRDLLESDEDESMTLRTMLTKDLQGLLKRWSPQRDLLASQSNDCHFVSEFDEQGRSKLRFGDGELGRHPDPAMMLFASYRISEGLDGNVGAESIAHIVFRGSPIDGVTLTLRNPMPASGGTASQSLEEARMEAPHKFRQELQRAIVAEDYARLAGRHPKVQRAAASLRWTGSGYQVLVAIDSYGAAEADQALLDEIYGMLYPYRRMGHDLRVEAAHTVALDIELHVCVLPDFLRAHVKLALLDLFSNRLLPDGRKGFFHPDNVSFGEGIYLSQLVAAAQAVKGVENVIVNKLERLYEGRNGEIDNGVLPLAPLDIARLDNDPSFPENGRLNLIMGGGR